MNKQVNLKKARRKAVNVSMAPNLIAQAKELGINISEVSEAAIQAEIRKASLEKWKAENQSAIDNYNRRIMKSGVFSEGQRRF